MQNKFKTNNAIQITAALFFIVLYTTVSINAQSTILKLPTINNTSDFSINDNASTNLFKLSADGSLLSYGAYTGGTAPSLGSGTRLWWYPKKAAFRVGYVSGTQWDGTSVGNNSFASGRSTTASGGVSTAMGENTTASGANSTAMGFNTTASGLFSTALGFSTTASGDHSTAMGYVTTANGIHSTAMGDHTKANGDYSTAMGRSSNASAINSTALGFSTSASGGASTAMGQNTTASGYVSTAMGDNTTASGDYSTAMGENTTASGDYSTAMGYNVSTNLKLGSFIIGDKSSSTMTSNTSNQMKMRFSGGYKFFTDISASIGARLMANANSWSTISDSTKKYAFLPVNGESVLNKINRFNLRSWSYKGQDSTMFRHYGPMAQEFFAAFGHDKYGLAGNDTTISQADFEGINLTAIHALIKRTDELKSKTEELALLKQKVSEQHNQLAMQQKQIKELNKMKTEFAVFKQAVNNLLINKNADTKIKLTINK